MKLKLLLPIYLLCFLLYSCNESAKTESSEVVLGDTTSQQIPQMLDSTKVTIDSSELKLNSIDLESIEISAIEDTLMQQAFWKSIAIPILQKNKKKVLATMAFPLSGDYMVVRANKPGSGTKEYFEKKYDAFFNKEFMDILATQSYRDVWTHQGNDTTWYHFQVGNDGAALIFGYYEQHNHYYLKYIAGAGGDFYAFSKDFDE